MHPSGRANPYKNPGIPKTTQQTLQVETTIKNQRFTELKIVSACLSRDDFKDEQTRLIGVTHVFTNFSLNYAVLNLDTYIHQRLHTWTRITSFFLVLFIQKQLKRR